MSDELFFHTTTHNCYSDRQLLEYRVRQREHGARLERAHLLKILGREWDKLDKSWPYVGREREQQGILDGLELADRLIREASDEA